MAYKEPKSQEWKADKFSKSYIADYKPFTAVDGEGLRCSIYVSGCLFACDECFNKEAWSFRYGNKYTQELEDKILADLSHPYIQGLTLLGGEPFLNTPTLLPLVKRIKEELPTKDIWSWSGYTFEQLLEETEDKKELLEMVDVLVDGPFIVERKLINYRGFMGSNNQRILDIQASLKADKAVAYKDYKPVQKSEDLFSKRS